MVIKTYFIIIILATVGQNSSSVQMASAYYVGAAVLAHVARRGQLDSALDERSLSHSQLKKVDIRACAIRTS